MFKKYAFMFFFIITPISCAVPSVFESSDAGEIIESEPNDDSFGFLESDIGSEIVDSLFQSDTETDSGEMIDTDSDTDTDTDTDIGDPPDFVCDGHAPENGCATPDGCYFVDLSVCYLGDPVRILALNYQYGWTICSSDKCPNTENDCFIVSNTIGLSCHE